MKAQIQSQVFVYILSVVVLGLIFFFGYKWYNGLRNTQEEVTMVELKKDLVDSMGAVGYGESVVKNYYLPTRYSRICFVDISDWNWLETGESNPIIERSVSDGVMANVFLVGVSTEPLDYAGNITLGKRILCKDAVHGKVTLRLEGGGTHVTLT